MKLYRVNHFKYSSITIIILMIIGLFVFITNYQDPNALIRVCIPVIILILMQLPFNQVNKFAIDEENFEIIIWSNSFLFWKSKKMFKIHDISYTYQNKRARSIAKDKVFSIYMGNRRVFKMYAANVGYQLLDRFATDLNLLSKSENNSISSSHLSKVK